jgi:hypothetical protein
LDENEEVAKTIADGRFAKAIADGQKSTVKFVNPNYFIYISICYLRCDKTLV